MKHGIYTYIYKPSYVTLSRIMMHIYIYMCMLVRRHLGLYTAINDYRTSALPTFIVDACRYVYSAEVEVQRNVFGAELPSCTKLGA